MIKMNKGVAASRIVGIAVLTFFTQFATGCKNHDSGADANAGSIFLDVLPAGNNGNSAGGAGLPLPGFPAKYPPNFADQAGLYGDLSYAQPNLRAAPCNPPVDISQHSASSDLACNYFKNEGLTPDKVVSTEKLATPYDGTVTIQRDGWGVPFVTADNRRNAMYGFGYAQAEDRLWLLDALRNVGRGRLTEFLGAAPEFVGIDAGLALTAGYSEDELAQMVDASAAKFGDFGTFILGDIDADLAGINAYIDSLSGVNADKKPPEYLLLKQGGFPPPHFTRNDIVASAIFIQALFAIGGGSESTNELLLQQIDPTVTAGVATVPENACKIWRDIRHADDPDATRTTDHSAQQSPASLDETCPQTLPAGAAIWDVGSYQAFNAYVVGEVVAANAVPTVASRKNSGAVARGVVHTMLAAHKAHGSRSTKLRATVALSPYEQLRGALRRAGVGLPGSMSNWMAVTAAHTQSGHPIGVMGPQTSYFDPQLLWEVALKSNGGTALDFNGRGIVFANLPYILIGRGSNYAWSATSGDSDLIDTRVSYLCNLDGSPASRDTGTDGFPQADGYLYDVGDGNGMQCRPLYRRHDEWIAKPSVASIGSSGPLARKQVDRYVLRTHYGPVFATATVNGLPAVISTQRSTFFGELDTTVPFALTATSSAYGAQRFQQLFNGVTGTFNWLYVDSTDVGYVQSGLLPLRAAAQSPDLPVWGDGRYEWANDRALTAEFFSTYGGSVSYPGRVTPVAQNGGPLNGGYYEWQNFLPLASHPQDLNPAKGYILSWNNSPAKGWWAADNRAGWAAIHRVDTEKPRFDAFLAANRKFDFANVVEIMGDAGYTDLRGQELLPLLLRMMQAGTLTSTQQQIVDSMQQWIDDGSSAWISGQPGLGAWRRDRDGDGKYDSREQVVLMDAWYLHLMDTMTSQLAALAPDPDAYGLTSCSSNVILCRYDAPRAQGSAYEFGWYQIMYRMLQTTLNTPGHTDYRALLCAGTGVFDDCRTAVLSALDLALTDLGGWNNHTRWSGRELPNAMGKTNATVEQYDEIEFQDFSLLADPAMPWINRPTFQQVVEIH